MKTKIVIVLITVLSISACRNGYGGGKNHNNDIPEIRSFNIVDSYNINSEFEFGPYQLSPYLSDGIFEVFWEVDSFYPYRVELFLNNNPFPDFGTKLSSEWCGFGERCGNYSYQFCRYRENLTMICELPESFNTFADQDISNLFNGIPQDLYFTLEVCDEDLFYCEYQSIPVTLE